MYGTHTYQHTRATVSKVCASSTSVSSGGGGLMLDLTLDFSVTLRW